MTKNLAAAAAKCRVLVSGSTGLIGRSVCTLLKERGHEVIRLVRPGATSAPDSISWDPQNGAFDKEDFEGFDAVIHLAGRNITGKFWTKKEKEALFLSRCRDTWLLSQVLLRLHRPPQTLITASGIGYYGNRGDELLTEESAPGRGFLADLSRRWEEASSAIEQRGTRVVRTRFGIVLTPDGGLYAKLAPLFRYGLGFDFKGVDPFVSWIALEDVTRILAQLLFETEVSGSVNCVSPHPLRYSEFAEKIAAHFHKRVRLHLPAKWVERLLGEMGKNLLLKSARVAPKRLEELGYCFSVPTLNDFFRQLEEK